MLRILNKNTNYFLLVWKYLKTFQKSFQRHFRRLCEGFPLTLPIQMYPKGAFYYYLILEDNLSLCPETMKGLCKLKEIEKIITNPLWEFLNWKKLEGSLVFNCKLSLRTCKDVFAWNNGVVVSKLNAFSFACSF